MYLQGLGLDHLQTLQCHPGILLLVASVLRAYLSARLLQHTENELGPKSVPLACVANGTSHYESQMWSYRRTQLQMVCCGILPSGLSC